MTQAQRRALEQLWPIYGLSSADGLIDIPVVFNDTPHDVDHKNFEIILDIGFGMGDALCESMEANPLSRFIGVEVHRPGVGHLMSLAVEKSLTNLRIYRDDVTEVLAGCIPDGSLDKVQIFFPDPWPKKKHHKRRLVQKDFIKQLALKLKKGGLIHLVTDWPDYAEQMQAVIRASSDVTESDRVISRPVTKYEQRAIRLGHEIFEFICVKACD
jgi:tRNA (guanine-N7-)-methyltransferase